MQPLQNWISLPMREIFTTSFPATLAPSTNLSASMLKKTEQKSCGLTLFVRMEVVCLVCVSDCRLLQPPPVVPVVDHLAGHSTVDADVLAGDEAGLVGTELLQHIGDVTLGGRVLSSS